MSMAEDTVYQCSIDCILAVQHNEHHVLWDAYIGLLVSLFVCACQSGCLTLQERELQECTFSPKITTMPAYMQRSEDGMYSSMTGRSNAKYAERAAQRTVDWV